MKFKVQSSKFKVAIIVSLLALFGITFAQTVRADAVTDNALNFLKAKQDADGSITTGFSAPSQWSAIAFAIHGIDVATVKNLDKSLLDFLLTDVPINLAAPDYETRVLAIVAIGQDPTNFGGTNYLATLESFYNNNQLGDECPSATPEVKKFHLNDDIFGLLALIASGDAANQQIKQDVLNFLISKQDPTDGGFGFSEPGCDWYMTSADITGAALQALVEAKNHGLTHPNLDSAIDKTKAYLLANQNPDGGFGYFGSSDTDTTGWVLMGLNVSGMKDDAVAVAARDYLISQQSATDGGITAFDWLVNTLVSNASTTAQGIIALSGKGWLVKIFDPATASSSATPLVATSTPTPTNTPTPTPTSAPSNNTPTPTPTVTPTPTPELDSSTTTLASILNNPLAQYEEQNEGDDLLAQITSIPQKSVLAASDEKKDTTGSTGAKGILIGSIFAGLGISFIFIYLAKPFIIRKFR